MITVTLARLIAGYMVSAWGYYTPFMYGGVILGSIGAGLLTTWTVDASTGKWIGYQILFGAGVGVGLQQSIIAVQTDLPLPDIPTGTVMIMFAQMFGGSLFMSVAQNLLTAHLVSGLAGIPGVDLSAVINSGATEIANLIQDPAVLQSVRVVYNDAVMKAFLVAVIMNSLGILGALGTEWRSVKARTQSQANESKAA